ncbi:MAG: metal-dependent transcriptional regulator [Candidatus Kapabacteria bacterium]|nr:metal-dependent transcriptional regulator [Candidatus Kapabacteria bacterium]
MRDLSTAMQDYIKAIFMLGQQGSVGTNDLARHLNVSAASVTSMVKKLSDLNLVRHQAYQGAELTISGRKVALELIRHHRLIETYLAEALGYAWHEVHEEAERLEHHISEAFEEKIDALLGHPRYDPHGDPIPAKDGRMPPTWADRLCDAPDGSTVVLRRVSDHDATMLQYLHHHGLLLATTVRITDRMDNGDLTVQVGRRRVAVPLQMARHMFVEHDPDEGRRHS